MIVGLSRDPVFGPVLLVGTGGVFAEVFRDVAVRPLPVDRRDVEEMVASLRGSALLAGRADDHVLIRRRSSMSRFRSQSSRQPAATASPSSTSIRSSCAKGGGSRRRRLTRRAPALRAHCISPRLMLPDSQLARLPARPAAQEAEGPPWIWTCQTEQRELETRRQVLAHEQTVQLADVSSNTAGRRQRGGRAVGPDGRARLAVAHGSGVERWPRARCGRARRRLRTARPRTCSGAVPLDRVPVRDGPPVAGSPNSKRFLDPVAASGAAGTLAVAEAAGSFDLGGVRATFRRSADGAGFCPRRGEGVRSRGFVGHHIVVVAPRRRSTGAEGLGSSSCPPIPRASRSRRCPSSTRPVTLGRDAVFGGGRGRDHAREPRFCAGGAAEVLEEATMMLAAEMVGTCQRIVDIILQHAKTREQFGVKIGSFQSMKHKLANMYVAVEAARATVRYAAAAIAERRSRRTLAVSMAKASAGDCEKARRRGGDPVPRGYRLHVGTRHASLCEARGEPERHSSGQRPNTVRGLPS